jgi:hypothetical protein
MALGDAVIDAALEALAHHRAHRPAEELKLEGTGNDWQRVQGTREHHHRIALAGSLLRLDKPVAVALAIAEFQWVLGSDPRANLRRGVGVEEALEPIARADAHVMAALRANIEVALELGTVEHGVARRTLDPQALRDRARTPFGLDARGHDLVEPGHLFMIADQSRNTAGARGAGSAKAAG